jgi:hypothetical protein
MSSFSLQMPEQFSFAVTLMNVLLVLSQTEFAQSMIHSGVMQHLWMQLLPPEVPEEMTEQVNSTTVSMILVTWRMLTSHLYLHIVLHLTLWPE